MNLTSQVAAACFYIACLSQAACAVPITFGNTNVDRLDLAGLQSEAGFTYQTLNNGWELQTNFGNPVAALVTWFNGTSSAPGDTMTFLRSGGGLFTFNQFDFESIGLASETVEWRGFVGVTQTQSLLVSSQASTFTTVLSGFTAAIDRLELVTITSQNARVIDNVDLTAVTVAVPEIDSTRAALPFAFFAVGLCLLGKRRNPSGATA